MSTFATKAQARRFERFHGAVLRTFAEHGQAEDRGEQRMYRYAIQTPVGRLEFNIDGFHHMLNLFTRFERPEAAQACGIGCSAVGKYNILLDMFRNARNDAGLALAIDECQRQIRGVFSRIAAAHAGTACQSVGAS